LITVYFTVKPDGTRSLPVKIDGKYHVIGDLDMVDQSTVKSLFSLVIPLFRSGGEHTKIVISPLMRYITGKCCSSPEHITNRCSDE
jgi:hypothetical protein